MDPHATPPDGFVVDPWADLPPLDGAGRLNGVTRVLLDHIRGWAPGFAVPSAVSARFAASPRKAGFTVGRVASASVVVDRTIRRHPDRVRGVLAAGVCLHALRRSNLLGPDADRNRRTATLAAVACGFGEVVQAAFDANDRVSGARDEIFGLTFAECQKAQEEVLNVRRAKGFAGCATDRQLEAYLIRILGRPAFASLYTHTQEKLRRHASPAQILGQMLLDLQHDNR